MFTGLAEFLRQLDDARQRSRRLHHATVTAAAERVAAVQPDNEIEALVQDPGKRPRGVESQRRQNRNDLFIEVLAEPRLLLVVPLVALYEAHAGLGQLRKHDVIEKLVLLSYEFRDAFAQGVE